MCRISLCMYSTLSCSCLAEYNDCNSLLCHSQCARAGQEGHQSKCKRCVCIVVGDETTWQHGSGKTPSATLIALLKGTKLCSLFVACIWQSNLCTTEHWPAYARTWFWQLAWDIESNSCCRRQIPEGWEGPLRQKMFPSRAPEELLPCHQSKVTRGGGVRCGDHPVWASLCCQWGQRRLPFINW